MAVVYRYHTAWAGSRLLIFTKGQCESLIRRDRRGETYSHVFFVSIIFEFEFGQFGDDWPALHCAPKLREKVNITIFKNLFINNLNF